MSITIQMSVVSNEQGLSEDKIKEILQEEPDRLWHPTYVGLVKSAGSAKMRLGAHLPYQRQYFLSQQAIEGLVGPAELL